MFLKFKEFAWKGSSDPTTLKLSSKAGSHLWAGGYIENNQKKRFTTAVGWDRQQTLKLAFKGPCCTLQCTLDTDFASWRMAKWKRWNLGHVKQRIEEILGQKALKKPQSSCWSEIFYLCVQFKDTNSWSVGTAIRICAQPLSTHQHNKCFIILSLFHFLPFSNSLFLLCSITLSVALWISFSVSQLHQWWEVTGVI